MTHPTAGVAFKPQHFDEAMAAPAAGLWFEVHAENYMVAGGPRLGDARAFRAARPLSLHGVGRRSAARRPRSATSRRAQAPGRRFDPFLVSEHLAWSRIGTRCLPDLLPCRAPAKPALHHAQRGDRPAGARAADPDRESGALSPGRCHELERNRISREIIAKTGCGLLLDVNNVAGRRQQSRLSCRPLSGGSAARGDRRDPYRRPHARSGPWRGLLIDSHDCAGLRRRLGVARKSAGPHRPPPGACSNATATCLPSPTSWPSATAPPPSLPERFSLMSDLATYQRDFVATLDDARDGHSRSRSIATPRSRARSMRSPTITRRLRRSSAKALLALAADFVGISPPRQPGPRRLWRRVRRLARSPADRPGDALSLRRRPDRSDAD